MQTYFSELEVDRPPEFSARAESKALIPAENMAGGEFYSDERTTRLPVYWTGITPVGLEPFPNTIQTNPAANIVAGTRTKTPAESSIVRTLST